VPRILYVIIYDMIATIPYISSTPCIPKHIPYISYIPVLVLLQTSANTKLHITLLRSRRLLPRPFREIPLFFNCCRSSKKTPSNTRFASAVQAREQVSRYNNEKNRPTPCGYYTMQAMIAGVVLLDRFASLRLSDS